jgi:8-hydroxy-5-deazaflavin:NADPH oxidoreductase
LEETTVKIAIVGAGTIGADLTRKLSALGHQVSVANSRGADTLADLAAETGAIPADLADVARGAEVVILALPTKSIPDLPQKLLAGAAPNVVVVDLTNYAPRQRDGLIAEIENGEIESRWTEGQIGHPVVKALNTLGARQLAGLGTEIAAERIALPVAGDDPGAKGLVAGLIDELGFDVVDAGGLDESWRQQPGSPVFTSALDAAAVERGLAAADPERPEAWRAVDGAENGAHIHDPFFHVGFVVRDLSTAMNELSTVLGTRWRPIVEARVPFVGEGGEVEIDVRTVYSTGGPPAIELIEAVPGSVLAGAGAGEMSFHHLGVWTEDLEESSTHLTECDWPCVATVAGADGKPNRFTLQQTRHGFFVELFDVAAARYPDLLPDRTGGLATAP